MSPFPQLFPHRWVSTDSGCAPSYEQVFWFVFFYYYQQTLHPLKPYLSKLDFLPCLRSHYTCCLLLVFCPALQVIVSMLLLLTAAKIKCCFVLCAENWYDFLIITFIQKVPQLWNLL